MGLTNFLLSVNDGIAVITINREEKRNALDTATLQELFLCIKQLAKNAKIRAAILTGAGEKAFVSGADISEMSKKNAAQADRFARLGHTLLNAIENTPFPVIAAVNGFALGGGSELVLACDIVYASETAVFGFPEGRLGVVLGFGGTQRLPRIVGVRKAKELMISGRKITAREACECGLVNAVFPAAALMNEAMSLARDIASQAPLAVRLCKQLANLSLDVTLKKGLAAERKAFVRCFKTKDQKEGMQAFLEKRSPRFSGK